MRGLVVGGGSIGFRHWRNLRALGIDATLVEPEPGRREWLLEQGAAVEATLERGLAEGPKIVVVATPTALHVGQALAAARAGSDLFIEKPLAHELTGTKELLEEVEKRKLVTLVGCNMRFHPGPTAIKDQIEKRGVGRVIAARLVTASYLPRWRPHQDYRKSYSADAVSGGAILDCIHEIDLALWFFGSGQVAAAAVLPATDLGLETDGLAEILIRHDVGVLSSLHLSFVERDYRRSCLVVGSNGTLSWDYTTGRVEVYGPDGAVAATFSQPESWDVNDMYVAEMRHFLDAVETRSATVNPIAGGVRALEIALAARRHGSRA